jgi:hypothetical protein
MINIIPVAKTAVCDLNHRCDQRERNNSGSLAIFAAIECGAACCSDREPP